jgi:hypothetical protein
MVTASFQLCLAPGTKGRDKKDGHLYNSRGHITPVTDTYVVFTARLIDQQGDNKLSE